MSVFNRLLIILLAILLLVATGAVLLGILQPTQLEPGRWFVDRLMPFAQLDPTLRDWTLGVGVVLFLPALVLLVIELRPAPHPDPWIMLKDDGLGRVTVARDGVRELSDREASHVVGVMSARSRVEETPTGLTIVCRISVDPTRSIPEMSQELRDRLEAVVEHHLGLPVT